jgi:3-phenylpropionate/trans-cinnamate dioxygenase ferredoxin reductase subunit
LEGIHYLRSLQDSDRLRARLDRGGHLAVVGAGWIGSEVAASAREKGLEVTLIDPLELPNEKVFGREVGEFYRDVHASHGVNLLLGHGVEALEGDGSVSRVRTSEGTTVDCDFVAVGVGVAPCVALAERGGLEVDNGILVDERLRTSADNVFAAGDVANHSHPFFGRRIMTGFPTSSPISTTWAWSTRATWLGGMRSCSAATGTTASSSPSGCPTGA